MSVHVYSLWPYTTNKTFENIMPLLRKLRQILRILAAFSFMVPCILFHCFLELGFKMQLNVVWYRVLGLTRVSECQQHVTIQKYTKYSPRGGWGRLSPDFQVIDALEKLGE